MIMVMLLILFLYLGELGRSPVSHLYILVAEVLACNIRAHSSISGLQLPHSSVPLSCVSAYADGLVNGLVSDQSRSERSETVNR